MTLVVWTFAALADIEGIRRYIGHFNPHAARDMAARIIEVGNSLANFPYRGRAVPGTQLRETTLARPYIIRYRVEPDRVLILRPAWRPPSTLIQIVAAWQPSGSSVTT